MMSQNTPDLVPDRSPHPALSSGFAVAAGLTFCLIVVGALVRAHDAGLACPDWPLCYGEVVPHFDLKIAFEWGHRVFAGAISLGLAGLTFFMVRQPDLKSAFRNRLILVWLVLAVQVVFGGLTVLLQLAPWTVSVHLILGNTFCLLLLWTSRDLAEGPARRDPRETLGPGLRLLSFAVAFLLLVQMVLGGWVSSNYAGLACTHFPTCNGQQWVPTWEGLVGIQIIHRINGVLLLAAYGVLAFLLSGKGRLGSLSALGLGLVLLQIGVGVANVLLRLPIWVTALHSGLAAAIVLVTALCVRRVVRLGSVYGEGPAPSRMVEAR
ncbi:MAG: COX15/CtaA family protein [Myxococcota bacterium]|nr:COX15/CtaA family protein [Myxococcota bacterium]